MADAKKAPQMQAYMKSEMPFHGVQSPQQKTLLNALFRQYPCHSQIEWHESMLDLWQCATHREERYAAIALAGVKYYRPFQDMQSLKVYRHMIVEGAWWDFVDSLSSRLGELLLDQSEQMLPCMNRWSQDKHLWKRRSSIICQLKLKANTNVDLLFRSIDCNLSDDDFFIRKAIGWALREYGKTSPASVIRYVEANIDTLSPLSKKESLRMMLKQGIIPSSSILLPR